MSEAAEKPSKAVATAPVEEVKEEKEEKGEEKKRFDGSKRFHAFLSDPEHCEFVTKEILDNDMLAESVVKAIAQDRHDKHMEILWRHSLPVYLSKPKFHERFANQFMKRAPLPLVTLLLTKLVEQEPRKIAEIEAENDRLVAALFEQENPRKQIFANLLQDPWWSAFVRSEEFRKLWTDDDYEDRKKDFKTMKKKAKEENKKED